MYFLNGFLILCLLLFCPLDGFAKIYKWVDENGQIHLTDKKVIKGCIRGDCTNGIGAFYLADGTRYKGEFKDGIPHGEGIWIFPDGKQYMGGFKDGKFHGIGAMTGSDGRKYVGKFRNGEMYGQGTLIDTDGTFHKKGKQVPENPISAISRVKAKSDLKESLSRKYGSSYSTVKHLLDSGMEAYDKLCEVPSNSVNNGILSKLKRKYYPHFSTIKMLYESNKKAYGELNRQFGTRTPPQSP